MNNEQAGAAVMDAIAVIERRQAADARVAVNAEDTDVHSRMEAVGMSRWTAHLQNCASRLTAMLEAINGSEPEAEFCSERLPGDHEANSRALTTAMTQEGVVLNRVTNSLNNVHVVPTEARSVTQADLAELEDLLVELRETAQRIDRIAQVLKAIH